MIPSLRVESLCCSLFVLVVAEHYVQTACENLSRDVLGIGAVNLYLHVNDGLSA